MRFDSRIEAVYGAELRLMARAGLINDLVFHPRYVAHVKAIDPGGRDSTISWTPDGAYTKNGVRVVYDVKAKGAPLDPVFMLKKRIFGDALDATIRIVRK